MHRSPAKTTSIRLTDEDHAFLEALAGALGLGSKTAVMRFAVRKLAREHGLALVPAASDGLSGAP